MSNTKSETYPKLSPFFRNGPKLSFNDWNKYLNEIASNKKVDVNTIKTKLVECGEPGFTGETVFFILFISNNNISIFDF